MGEIINNLELIAAYEGLVKDEEMSIHMGKPMYKKNGTITDLRYNTSWNWLMPIVERVGVIGGSLVKLTVKGDNSICSLDVGLGGSFKAHKSNKALIILTFNAVVEYIKWYNAMESL